MLVIHHLKGFLNSFCRLITLMLLSAALVAPARGQDSTKDPQLEGARKPNSREPGSPTNVNPLTGLGTASQASYAPLTGKQRWQFYVKSNFASMGAFTGPVLNSLLDQIENQPPEWGREASGYGQRLASRLGTAAVQGTVQSAGCALLGQDPRYIRSSSEKVLNRSLHAILFGTITYNNEGKKRPALATLSSYYDSSVIATSWLPDRYTSLGDGVRDANRQVVLSCLVNEIQEFWPELKRLLPHKIP
jgi:hypothetical protein